MPDTHRVIYWDANVFLSYVNKLADRMAVMDAPLSDRVRVVNAFKWWSNYK